jgi:hypothetical protein
LEVFEREQLEKLKQELDMRTDILLEVLHGGVQFVSLKRALRKEALEALCKDETFQGDPYKGDDEACQVISVIGINYHQNKEDLKTDRRAFRFQPYLGTVDDRDPPEKPVMGMRKALDFTLSAYTRNAASWKEERHRWKRKVCRFSSAIESPPTEYILLVTNLSPFITKDQWGKIETNKTKSLLSTWDYNRHLAPLARLLSGRVDLWVGHGSDAVWWDFYVLSEAMPNELTPWLVTYNLSSEGISGLTQMKIAQSKKDHPYHSLFV